jgi:hypothetical protein
MIVAAFASGMAMIALWLGALYAPIYALARAIQ